MSRRFRSLPNDENFFENLFAGITDPHIDEQLDIAPDASEQEIMAAFRTKVREMTDGHGGYTGDMDALVTAKEQALSQAQKREGKS